jgi:DNA (cytosine-5)-methyltransferase 1
VDTSETTIRHLSICSGYEGIGLGLRRIFRNVTEVALVEREAFSVAVLVKEMEKNRMAPAPIWTDINTFPFHLFRGKAHIWSSGLPCQPFSNSGLRKSDRDERHLFPILENGIRKCRPPLVFLENVEGIITTKTKEGEPVLKFVLRRLESLGYLAEAGIFSASECGGGHQRKRVFVLAYSDSKGLEGWDSKSLQKYASELSPRKSRTPRQVPAPINEPQHLWESPRTLPIKSGLDGATYGVADRVDRTRILGNGVFPRTAEKAFRILAKKLIQRIEK